MTVSLKVAARRFLRWNKKGQKVATPKRNVWIAQQENGKCVACKIGLVMIGRYGLHKATKATFGKRRAQVTELVNATLNYGPSLTCPIRGCRGLHHSSRKQQGYPPDPYYASLGNVTEHLFEQHKRSVKQIDEWLANLAKHGELA